MMNAARARTIALHGEFGARGLEDGKAVMGNKVELLTLLQKSLGWDSGVPALESPIKGVTAEQWGRFVGWIRGRNVSEISDAHHLGLFNVGYLRLRDLGFARALKQVVTGKGKRVWIGKMVPPLTEEKFLSDAGIQYRVFVLDMRDRMKLVSPFIGMNIDDTVTTASGLLVVAKIAGTRGFHKWITDPAERKRFERTTAAYLAANGIF